MENKELYIVTIFIILVACILGTINYKLVDLNRDNRDSYKSTPYTTCTDAVTSYTYNGKYSVITVSHIIGGDFVFAQPLYIVVGKIYTFTWYGNGFTLHDSNSPILPEYAAKYFTIEEIIE